MAQNLDVLLVSVTIFGTMSVHTHAHHYTLSERQVCKQSIHLEKI